MTYAKAKACFSSPPAARTRRGDKYKFKGGDGAGDALNRTRTHTTVKANSDKTRQVVLACVDKARIACPAVGYLFFTGPAE